ncbi:MAG TPA: YceI family protein [Chthoniobacterales bacterium]
MKKLLIALGLATFAAAGLGRADTYKVDPVHSFLRFKVSHFYVGSVLGRFDDLGGQIVLDPADVSKSSVNFTAKSASVDTGNPKRDEHLKSPDFFNVKQFPDITFTSTKVEKTDDKTLSVTGNLTLLGVTKPQTVTVKELGTGKGMQGETRAGFETTFTVKRSDYGMNFMVGPAGDEVTLSLDVEGVKQP